MLEERIATAGADAGAAMADHARNREEQKQEEQKQEEQKQEEQKQEERNTEAKAFTEAELNAEADRRATKAARTAIENFKQNELPGLITKVRTEAERLARMTAEQKAEHERRLAEEELDRRLADITRRELKIEAHKVLTDKGLPAELLEIVPCSSAEACEAGIEAIERAFRAAVGKGVNERFKANPPPQVATGRTGTTKTVTELMREANQFPDRLPQIMAQIQGMRQR